MRFHRFSNNFGSPLLVGLKRYVFSPFSFCLSRLFTEFIKAAFSNALRLSPSPRNSTEGSVPSLKRSISNNEFVTEKIFKISDENNQSHAIKKTIKHGKLREKKIKSIEPMQVVSTRPKRNIKPINRY